MKIQILFVITLNALIISACASPPEPLYSWGNYETQVYAFLNRESSPHEQLGVLELELQLILTSGKRVPPGFFAHLGMLHTETGNHAGAIAYFMEEKALFPESAVFMDFILGNLQSQGSSESSGF
jgi:hypothetical protein